MSRVPAPALARKAFCVAAPMGVVCRSSLVDRLGVSCWVLRGVEELLLSPRPSLDVPSRLRLVEGRLWTCKSGLGCLPDQISWDDFEVDKVGVGICSELSRLSALLIRLLRLNSAEFLKGSHLFKCSICRVVFFARTSLQYLHLTRWHCERQTRLQLKLGLHTLVPFASCGRSSNALRTSALLGRGILARYNWLFDGISDESEPSNVTGTSIPQLDRERIQKDDSTRPLDQAAALTSIVTGCRYKICIAVR